MAEGSAGSGDAGKEASYLTRQERGRLLKYDNINMML